MENTKPPQVKTTYYGTSFSRYATPFNLQAHPTRILRVSSTLQTPSESVLQLKDPEPHLTSYNDHSVQLQQTRASKKVFSPVEHSLKFYRRSDVASLLRKRQRNGERLREALSADEISLRNSTLHTLADNDVAPSTHLSTSCVIQAQSFSQCRSLVSNAISKHIPQTTRSDLKASFTKPKDSFLHPGLESNNGISPVDNRRSSVVYEPALTDYSFTSSSPSLHGQKSKLLAQNETLDSEVNKVKNRCNDVDNDNAENMEKQTSKRNLLSLHNHPSQIKQHGGGQASVSYLSSINFGNGPMSKAEFQSLPSEHHYTGIPRKKANIVRNPNFLPSTSPLYSRQESSAVVTPSTPPETVQYFSVVSTTLKPSQEVRTYSKSDVTERRAFGEYPTSGSSASPPHNSTTTSGRSNTVTPLTTKRVSLLEQYHFDSGMHHEERNSRKYTESITPFETEFWGKCSWKCIAQTFIGLSIILLALVTFFAVLLLSNRTKMEEVSGSLQCIARDNTIVTTVEKNGKSVELQLNKRSSSSIAPGSFKWFHFYIEKDSHVKFNCTVTPNAEMILYGRMGLRPSHTKFNFFKKIDGSLLPLVETLTSLVSIISMSTSSSQGYSRKRRSVSSNFHVNTGFLEYLEAGMWHLAVYNDGAEEEIIEIFSTISEDLQKCSNSCNNNGDCADEICKCFPGFQGKDCSQVSCVVTCRGNGVYSHGTCICFSGWKGLECAIPSNQCVEPDCGGHGQCGPEGECICEKGYRGESCQELDCMDPACSSHGICFEGQCRCDRGWKGYLCNEEDEKCFLNCTENGSFDEVTKRCLCQSGWGGADCSSAICRPICHKTHGVCVEGLCRCKDGWTGRACDVRQCHARCEEHGRCVQGECQCDVGWNGNLCTLAGCPNKCSNNGRCTRNTEGDWSCSCRSGWKGENCLLEVETQCTDGRDNDLDTLIDCQDPDCCSHRSCSRSNQCRGGLDPSYEFARVQGRNPTYPTASFFERTKFLISRHGVQIDADLSAIEAKRASVIRGRVLTLDGFSLIGVQVQVISHIQYGSTKTRKDGWFDILVNGGGSLSLSFQRSSFASSTITVFVPWNDYVIIPHIALRTLREPIELINEEREDCEVSRIFAPRALILESSVRAYIAAEWSEKRSIIPEIQAIREAVSLPTTQTSLIYLSSRMPGYQSRLVLSLIEGEKPANLKLIHLQISVQGKFFQKKFEPISELRYTFVWSRMDAYGRKVYGTVRAEVMIGYEYERCWNIAWKKIGAKLEGYHTSYLSSIASWSFDIHHTYHPEKGTIYLGNGNEMRLREQPPMMSTVMGDGMSRHNTCERCDGPAKNTRLMSPIALASDAHGNVYVGDHNFIRKFDTDGNISSLLRIENVPTRYYMTVNPVSGQLYFSHTTERRIYMLRQMVSSNYRFSQNFATNYKVVAGTGGLCHPLQKDGCGDGGLAINSKLSAPKGLTVDKEGRLYFIDGTRIRTVLPEHQTIYAFAGSKIISGTRPLICKGSMSLDQLELNFPTDLAISHMENALYILDGEVVIRIDITNRQASLSAGVPFHCVRRVLKTPDERDARKINLVSPTSICISPQDGALYISETDQKFIHRVRRVDTFSGRISTVAGMDSRCDCALQECQCYGGDGDFARSASLHNPSAVVATLDGSVYIADHLNLRIRKIFHSVPRLSTRREYSVSNPDTNQLYIFDHNGSHLATKNVITGILLYSFSYDRSGRLTSISDVNGNTLRVGYNLSGKPVNFVLPSSEMIYLQLNRKELLTAILRAPSDPIASFTYQDENGLLRSKVKGHHSSFFYVYDAYGRLITATASTGEMTTMQMQMNSTKHIITIATISPSKDVDTLEMGVGRRELVITTEPGYLCDFITTTEGKMTTQYKRWTDNSVSVHYMDDSELSLETKPHPVLGLTAPFLARRKIKLPADLLENKIEWRTRKETEAGISKPKYLLGRRMRVHDRNILSLDFSQREMTEKIYDDHAKFTLRIQYNNRSLPILWIPKGDIDLINVTYDSMGHLTNWKRGRYSEELSYDTRGNILSILMADGSMWRYTHSDRITYLNIPGSSSHYTFTYSSNGNFHRVTLPSGLIYTIDHKVGIGFIRTTITGTDNTFCIIQDYNYEGDLLSTFYPGENREVAYRYDSHGYVREIVHDSSRTVMSRDLESGELISISSNDCAVRFRWNGPLVQRQVVLSSRFGGFLATFDYTHDANLRVTSMEVNMNRTHLPLEHFSYNVISGQLTAFGSYRIIDLGLNLYTVGNTEVTLTKQIDGNGRVVQTEMEIYDTISFNMMLQHDVGGRISSIALTIGMYANETRFDYTYNKNGALNAVAENGEIKWIYGYDKDGKLSTIDGDGLRKDLRYDLYGRLISFGDIQYEFDQDGFLQQRGNEVFEYDSLGHLVKAYRLDNSYEIDYGYDGFGRLSTRASVKQNQVLRYLYADITKPTQLTHVYNASSGYVTTLRYDADGYLFAMERSDGIKWLVLCDHVGTPLAVTDIAGYIIKQIKYSPFGEVIYDTSPEIHLYIGFRGGIYDISTGLVHFSDRTKLSPFANSDMFLNKPFDQRLSTKKGSSAPRRSKDYDSLTGQYTSNQLTLLESMPSTGAPFKMYQVDDPINLVPKYKHMTDIESWLDAFRFKLENVAPDTLIASRQKDKSSAECQLSHHLKAYMNFQTFTPSALVTGKFEGAERSPTPDGSLFTQGLVIAVYSGIVTTQVVDVASNDVKLFGSVINNANVIVGKSADSSSAAMSLSLEGKPTLYLTKPAGVFDHDILSLQLIKEQARLLITNYVNEGSSQANDPIVVSFQENKIRAESGYAIINIIYVGNSSSLSHSDVFSTSEYERERILEEAYVRASQEAWMREKRKIQKGLKTRWSKSEQQEILSKGYLISYELKRSWDPDIYPELADSGRNLKFFNKKNFV